MPKISFVCPVFNKEKYLKKVLNSIKNQIGDFEKEYIFINDGSTDSSLELIKKKTANWKNTIVLSQKNKGPAIATQLGISNATGDYIKLVGGDDLMAPFCSDLLLKTIIKKKSVAAFSSYKLLETFNNVSFKRQKIQNFRVLEKPLLQTIKSSYSGTTPNLYCNNSIRKSGGCNKRIFVEDFSLVLGLSKIGSFSFINNITSVGPKNDKTRIMLGKKTQLLHDYNAALYYFIKKHSEIENHIVKTACKKSLGRSFNWYRREVRKSRFNKMFLYKVFLLFGRCDYLNLLKESCIFFYKNTTKDSIRYKIT